MKKLKYAHRYSVTLFKILNTWKLMLKIEKRVVDK